ncbi:3-dehydroquinate synthase [Lentibacillus amyloliquefaciens]|uniref:3-dehydroquinate synthase n=1 Tax=Lentibacillus amyloliquefaciens TaxID=1472767 RepID=A0A0U4F311_9BACI|nr:3-dehydroquinate synthase [Lentibacillus amyloliquefaciens]ALX47958.1 3-dehydroquinate synthase [Lentibacillus amyloliquefaciens]
MNKTQVKAATHTYPVSIGENLRHHTEDYLPKDYSSILIVTDASVSDYYLSDVMASLSNKNVFSHAIPSGEKAKNIDTFYEIQTKAIECGLDRQSLIIALGGGVVGDVTGFAAATYMRGIDFIQMPTTILAHDSSVGGKVAINHAHAKNMIGNFYAPAAVIYDVETLYTLNAKEVRSGYAELLKEALLADKDLYDALMKTDLTSLYSQKLINHLTKGIEIKAGIVEVDEHEAGLRKHLNLGHTLGHALESIFGYGSWTHGELVAIGLLFSLRVSEHAYSTNLPFEEVFTWLKNNDYPLQLPELDPETILSKMKSDKKTLNSKIQLVLLQAIGQPALMEISDEKLLKHIQDFQLEMKQRSEQGAEQYEK